MKKTILSILLAFILTISAQAASVVFAWDARPADEEITTYIVYQKVNGEYVVLGSTASLEIEIVNITPGKNTYAIAASNFWGPGVITEINTPAKAGAVGGFRIKSVTP